MRNIQFKNLKFHYVFGRFSLVRSMYSFYRNLFEKSIKNQVNFNNSIFKNTEQINVLKASDIIRKNSYVTGLNLESKYVDNLLSEAIKSKFDTAKIKNLTYEEIFTDKEIAIAYLQKPKEKKFINKISKDVFILNIVRNYIGYYPKNVDIKLIYSFSKNINDNMRREQHQTIDYHFDIHGLNFIYANFYLNDTNKLNGCHALIKGSHKKPLNLELGKARADDKKLFKFYDKSKEVFIEGKKGFGFLEDTSCYHKALEPKQGYRVMLQLRYY